jgi:hypothetical protein
MEEDCCGDVYMCVRWRRGEERRGGAVLGIAWVRGARGAIEGQDHFDILPREISNHLLCMDVISTYSSKISFPVMTSSRVSSTNNVPGCTENKDKVATDEGVDLLERENFEFSRLALFCSSYQQITRLLMAR